MDKGGKEKNKEQMHAGTLRSESETQRKQDDAVESAALNMQYAFNMQYAGSRQEGVAISFSRGSS